VPLDQLRAHLPPETRFVPRPSARSSSRGARRAMRGGCARTSRDGGARDKVWFVTGCSTGMGRDIAREALAQGYRVVLTARNPDTLADLHARFPSARRWRASTSPTARRSRRPCAARARRSGGSTCS
jgi:hypothetical protein